MTDAGRPATTDATASKEGRTGVLVWDRAVRVFHWLLVAGVATAWLSGGSGHRMHEIVGLMVAGLIAFRLLWGLIGSPHARFSDFVVSPWQALRYAGRTTVGRAARTIGHNPAGGYMILALLGTLIVVSVTGVMQLTNRFFGIEWVETVHHWAANALLVLVPLHVLGAIASSLLHRENLILAMITGRKPAVIAGHPAARPEPPDLVEGWQRQPHAPSGLSLLACVLIVGFAYGWVATAKRASSSGATMAATEPTVPHTIEAKAAAPPAQIPLVVTKVEPTEAIPPTVEPMPASTIAAPAPTTPAETGVGQAVAFARPVLDLVMSPAAITARESRPEVVGTIPPPARRAANRIARGAAVRVGAARKGAVAGARKSLGINANQASRRQRASGKY